MGSLARVAVNYPQTAYAGFAFCLQCEWQYASRISSNIAGYFEPLERVIRKSFLPALMDVGVEDIHPKWHQMLANSVKIAGMGIRNPVDLAGDAFETSSHATRVLVRSLVQKEPLDMCGHSCCVISPCASGRRRRLGREQDHIDEMGQGKPVIE